MTTSLPPSARNGWTALNMARGCYSAAKTSDTATSRAYWLKQAAKAAREAADMLAQTATDLEGQDA